AVRTTREKYIRLKTKFEDDPMGSMPPEAISNMTIRKMDGGKSAIYINGMQFRPRTHKWESIELE
ncbi:MAG: GLPGLI family protein, partial [Bacteroidales bacterium]|nr:GLPGLI family protein [Bacteroidales bacterium]